MTGPFLNWGNSSSRERIHALDIIRGVLILGMICDHILFDCTMLLGVGESVMENNARIILHDIGSYTFVFLSGVSSSVSRSNLKRGVMLIVIALALTLVTFLYNPSFFIVFGILHCLGCCAVIYALLRPALEKIPHKLAPVIWIISAVVLRIITFNIRTDIPLVWIFGFHSENFASLDYYPIFPWIFVFFLGAWFSPYVFEHRLPEWFYSIRCAFLEKVGKNSLLIYIIHQPVVIFILLVLKEMYFR